MREDRLLIRLMLLFLLLTLFSALTFFFRANADSLLIKKVAVVDPETELVTKGRDIYINDGGIIEEIGLNLTQSADVTLDCTNVPDAHAIPGLIDLHVHANAHNVPGSPQSMSVPTAASIMLFTGVTGFLDLGSTWERDMIGVRINEDGSKDYVTYRDAQRHYGFTGNLWQDFSDPPTGELPVSPPIPDVPFMPDIFTTTGLLNCDWCWGQGFGFGTRTFNSEEEAEAEVIALLVSGDTDLSLSPPNPLVRGVDAIKVVYHDKALSRKDDNPPLVAIRKAISTAHLPPITLPEESQLRRNVIAHINSSTDITQAIRAAGPFWPSRLVRS